MFGDLSALQGFGIGGFGMLILSLLTFIGNSYWKKRNETREDTKSERESESGIVETTSAAIEIVREQMVVMSVEMKELKQENKILDKRVDELENTERRHIRKIEDLELGMEKLERENKKLKNPLGS